MGEYRLHSLILAADYRVDDVDEMWEKLKARESELANFAAHHVVVYTSIWQAGRILVTIGVRHTRSVRETMRSPALFELFDLSGVDDIPAVFAGEVVEKIDLYETSPDDVVAGVIVGVVTSVEDASALVAEVRGAADRFRSAGIRKVWVYRALDDAHEVMILQEVDDESSTRAWLEHPDAAAEWMASAGLGAYPSIFVGRFAHLMSVGERVG